jgi:Putative MetA-pathway of phenol degradation
MESCHSVCNANAVNRALVAFMASAAAAQGDTEPICADSPGKASQACTVPAGYVQIETNLADWTMQKQAGQRYTELLIGDTNLKYGLTDKLDIGVELIPLTQVTSRVGGDSDNASGFGDLGVAVKYRLTRADAPLQLALFPFVKVPTAKRRVGNGKWEWGLVLPIVYSIGGTPFSINYSPELDNNADADGRGHHAGMEQVVTVTWAATDQLSLSAEMWGQWNWDPTATEKQYSADASIAYLVDNDVQLDAGANIGLNRTTPDVELYAGVSKRF